MWQALTEPNRNREGAATQEMTAAEGGRFLTGAVRMIRGNTCDGTLDLCRGPTVLFCPAMQETDRYTKTKNILE